MKIKKHIIYKYTSPSGKCYVGQTHKEERRKQEHQWEAAGGSTFPFHCAIRKYGIDNFEYEVICKDIPEELVNGLEIGAIHMEDAYTKGYNCTEGGEGAKGSIVSDEARLNMSKAREGIKFSRSTRQKMSEARKIKVKCIETGIIYESNVAAAQATGINKANLNLASRGKRKTAGGYHWKQVTK
jgi:group I intron endonuclease